MYKLVFLLGALLSMPTMANEALCRMVFTVAECKSRLSQPVTLDEVLAKSGYPLKWEENLDTKVTSITYLESSGTDQSSTYIFKDNKLTGWLGRKSIKHVRN